MMPDLCLSRHPLFGASLATALPKATVFLYAPAICDVRPAPGRMQRIGGGGNGAAMQTEDTGKGPVGASR